MSAQIINLRRAADNAEDAGERMLAVIGRAIANSITEDVAIDVPTILVTLDAESRVIGRQRARAALTSAWGTHWDFIEASLLEAATDLRASGAFDDTPYIPDRPQPRNTQMTTKKSNARRSIRNQRKPQKSVPKAAAPKQKPQRDPIGQAFEEILTWQAIFADLLMTIHDKRDDPKAVSEYIADGLREIDDACSDIGKARTRIRRAFREAQRTAAGAG